MKIIKIVILAVIMIFSTVLIGARADEKLCVNGVEVSKGDIVTFEYYISGVKDPIEAAGAYLIFDSSFLEYVDGSLGFDVLNNAMSNVGENSIYYCAINVTDGFDFSEEGLVAAASFRVLDSASGSTVITNEFDEIFTFVNEEEDLTSDDYIARESIKVNEAAEENIYHGTNAADISDSFDTASSANDDDSRESISVGVIVMAATVFVIIIIVIYVIIRKRKQQAK